MDDAGPAREQAGAVDAETRLRRLWKGTLLVGVAGGYALLVALLLVQHGWQAALLAVFFVVVAQVLRYIASDVDRIGWNLSQGQRTEAGAPEGRSSPVPSESAVRYQARLYGGLVTLVQVVNISLVAQAFLLGSWDRALATAFALAVIEILFMQVRKVNRQVTFEQASYGFSDRRLLSDGPSADGPWDEAANARLQRKLERLREMADAGEISAKAYRRERDKWLVRSVMQDDAKRI